MHGLPDEQTQLLFMLLQVLSQQKPETPLMEQPPLHDAIPWLGGGVIAVVVSGAVVVGAGVVVVPPCVVVEASAPLLQQMRRNELASLLQEKAALLQHIRNAGLDPAGIKVLEKMGVLTDAADEYDATAPTAVKLVPGSLPLLDALCGT